MQSFAIPCRVAKMVWHGVSKKNGVTQEDAARDIGRYLQPLATLAGAARHLWAVAYAGRGPISGSAIVEETLEDSTIWWLVLTHSTPTKEWK
eukprot:9614537-Alexandrium_andersonii.AAC.1